MPNFHIYGPKVNLGFTAGIHPCRRLYKSTSFVEQSWPRFHSSSPPSLSPATCGPSTTNVAVVGPGWATRRGGATPPTISAAEEKRCRVAHSGQDRNHETLSPSRVRMARAPSWRARHRGREANSVRLEHDHMKKQHQI